MKGNKHHIVNANQAVAKIAYKTNEVFPIYPITPASEMAELVEAFNANAKTNIFGSIPSVFQMQSEAGVAGAMHGAIQTGSLSSTFTASQGLLLMLPNMYKIAGELTPNVIHVATRSVATHALSVFGDHSDIMAVRQSGYAFLGAASVQEAQDFALISHIASINSNIPFVHFFDGFRTSHETAKIEVIPDAIIASLINSKNISNFRNRALNPNNPTIKGTAQGPDVFFQNREASNSFYNNCPEIVQSVMDNFASLTGRQYKIFEFIGHPKAENIIISMASSTETIEETITQLNSNGERIGLIKIRLFRPFSAAHLINALPSTAKTITVLDRTKEAGSIAEPLCLDVTQALALSEFRKKFNGLPKIIGGRYGLSSKEFTPSMVKAIVANAKLEAPKQSFTIGIQDDITNLSLNYDHDYTSNFNGYQVLFCSENAKKKEKSLSQLLSLIGKDNYLQSYTECNYKKSNTKNTTHLRISEAPIKAPYLINGADLLVCEQGAFLNDEILLNRIRNGGTIIILTNTTTTKLSKSIARNTLNVLEAKRISLYSFNLNDLNPGKFSNNNIEAFHLLGLTNFLGLENHTILNELTKHLIGINLEELGSDSVVYTEEQEINLAIKRLLSNKGDSLSVSMLPADGSFITDTSQYNPIVLKEHIPDWNVDACTQCGACSMACPLGALRIKAYEDSYLKSAPKTLKSTKSTESDWELDLLNYTIQINPDQCNGCNNCVDACNENALTLVNYEENKETTKNNWEYFNTIPELNRNKINPTKISQQQLQEPLFKYALGVEGCGEAPYLKLLSQLYGDRLLLANATGASSIFGGALPTTPWAQNSQGQGPAWANSLFEDNAEFGLGYRISINQKKAQAYKLLGTLKPQLPRRLVNAIENSKQKTELQINSQRVRVNKLKEALKKINTPEAIKLLTLADYLVEKSVWIVGGDGWAYDIGFGGIDHVLASGENVNILVLDNEVYDNTGGQTSKATPFGATAAFSFKGRKKHKKDLGKFAMMYPNVYVASVAIGADQEQTLKAFNEAESHDGPSIIIAYCHSEAHGIDMKNPKQYHEAIVNSGAWILYRRDPRNLEHNVAVFQLDTHKPKISATDYLQKEQRFKELLKPENKALVDEFQQKINEKINDFEALAANETELEKYYY